MWIIKGKIEWNVAEAQKCASVQHSSSDSDIIHNKFLSNQVSFCRGYTTDLAYQQKIQFKFSSTQLALPADMLQPQSMADSAQHHTTSDIHHTSMGLG